MLKGESVHRENGIVMSGIGNEITSLDTLRRRKTPTASQIAKPTSKLRSLYSSLKTCKRVQGLFMTLLFVIFLVVMLTVTDSRLELHLQGRKQSVKEWTEPWSLEFANIWFTNTASLEKIQAKPSESNESISDMTAEKKKNSAKEKIYDILSPQLQMWKHNKLDITICRIFGVCIDSMRPYIYLNGNQMKKHLESCGLRGSSYENIGSEEWKNRAAHDLNHSPHRHYDLTTLSPARTHMPHFIEDITSFLAAMDVVDEGGNNLVNKTFQKFCYSEAGMKVSSCNQFRDGLNPLFLFDPSGFHRFSGSWVNRFLSMLLKMEDVSSSVQVANYTAFNGCFRSVILARGNDLHCLLKHQNSLFVRNGLRKAAKDPSTLDQLPLRVTILSRDPQNARTLINAEYFAEKIRKLKLTKGIKKEGFSRNVRFTCEVVYFEGMDFAQQVGVMQKTDILVAVHGAGNTNIIFLPENSLMIEIYPFAYKANIFENLAKKYSVRYKSIIAEPDSNSFKKCMAKIEQTHPELKNKISTLTKEWDDAVLRFTRGDHSHYFKLESPTVSDSVPSSRVCARSQTLKINWDDLASIIQEQVLQTF
eukprot:jgi/Galph1/1065/GphlegSOOS_G5831.1